ncbi:MAG: lysostaphin resistance A-like protein [bacterium]
MEDINTEYEITIGKSIIYFIVFVISQLLAGVLIAFFYAIVYGIIFSLKYSCIDPSTIQNAIEQSLQTSYFLNVLLLIFADVILILFILYLKKRSKIKLNDIINIKKINIPLISLITLFSVSYMFVASELENIFTSIFGKNISFSAEFIEMARMPGLHRFLIAIIFIAVLPAIFEEIFFRGLIQNGLSRKYGDIKAIVIASILFALLHLNPSRIFPIFLLSLMLGFVFIKTMNLIYPITLHFINNLMCVFIWRYDALQMKGLINTSIENLEHLSIYYMLPAVLATIIISVAIYRIRLSDNKYHHQPDERLEEFWGEG